MKCLLAFAGFLLAGLALATHPFQNGKQYEFEYQGRIASGLIGVPPQYAGLGVKAKVILSPKDPENIVVEIKEPKVGKLNEKLRSESAFYSEELPISYSPLSQYSRELQTPFLVVMRSGQVTSVKVPQEEPTMIKNIKRAIASLIQINSDGVQRIPEKLEMMLPKSEQNSKKTSFSVMEETLSGVCETLYTINPLPEYLAQAQEKDVPVALRHVTAEGHLVITKVINLGNCLYKSAFHHLSAAPEECVFPEANCQTSHSKSSYTRYLVEGKRNNYLLKGIWNYGEFTVRPAEAHVQTVTYQTMYLKSLKSGPAPNIPTGEPISIVFDMPTLTPGVKKLDNEVLTKYPLFPVKPIMNKEISPRDIMSKIQQLLSEVSDKVEEYSKPEKTVLPMRVLEIVKGIQMLKYEDLKELSKQILSGSPHQQHTWSSYYQTSNLKKDTEMEIFLDCLAYAGTNPSILVIKDLISEGLLYGERAAEVLMVIPMTLSVPVPSIIEKIFEITQLPQVKEHSQMYSNSLLALTNIVYHSCINLNISRSSYPVHLFKEDICKPDDHVIVNKIVPKLKELLKNARTSHEKEVLLRSLGNLAHPEVLPILKEYAVGSSEQKDVQVRTMAIFSLDRCGKLYPKEVREILMPIMMNVMDHFEPRIAAITMLLETNPPMALFQQIALSTWFEPSVQVQSFVYSTFKSISNITYPSYNDTKMAMKAEMALQVTKPVAEGMHYSHNIYSSKHVLEQSLASKLQLYSIGSVDSLIPRRLYSKLSSSIYGTKYNSLKVSFFNQGTQKLINKLIFPEMSKQSSYNMPFDFWSQTGSDILSKIKTDIKESDVPKGRLHYKLYDRIERIFSYDETSKIVKDLLEHDMLNLDLIPKQKEFNIQKVMPLRETLVAVPTELGIPVVVTLKMPVFMSLRGNVQSVIEPKQLKPSTLLKNMPPVSVEVTADVKPLMSLQRIAMASIVTPFFDEHPVAGYEQLMQVGLPGKVYIKLDTSSKILKTEYTPSQVSEVSVVHMNIRPFTALYNPLEVKPVVESSSFKIITRQVQPLQKSVDFGKKYLGLDLSVNIDTEEPVLGFSSYYHWLQHHNPLTFLNFYYAQPGPIYNKKISLVYRPTSSDAKSIKMVTSYEMKPINQLRDEHRDYDTDYRPSRVHPSMYVEIPQYPTKKIAEMLPPRDMKIVRELKNVDYKLAHQHTLKTKLIFDGSPSREYYSEASIVNVTSSDYHAVKAFLSMQVINVPSVNKDGVSIVSEVQFPAIKAQKLQEYINTDISTVAWVDIKLPQSEEVQIAVKMDRDEQQKKYVQESVESKYCKENEEEGWMYSYNCTIARLQATALNKIYMNVEKKGNSQFSPITYKMLYGLDNLVKYVWYPHMQNDPMDKSSHPSAVDIYIKREPYKQIWDVEIRKPHEVTYFYNLHENMPVKYMLPLNAYLPQSRIVSNYALKGKWNPSCIVQQNYLKTYDNITISMKPCSQCWHLLTKDCSNEVKLAVYMMPTQDGKNIKVVLGKTEIVFEPSQQYPKLSIDNKKVPLSHENIEKPIYVMMEGYIVAVITTLPNRFVKLYSPLYKYTMYHDGKNAILEPSNVYRGRTCGLCGDFNGEKYADLKSPKMCALNTTDIKKYYDSWILPMKNCKSTPIPDEQCHPLQYIPTGEFISKLVGYQYMSSYPYYPKHISMYEDEETNHIIYTRIEIQRNGLDCVSVQKIPECKRPYVAEKITMEDVKFNCHPIGRREPTTRKTFKYEIPHKCVLGH